MSGKGDKHTQLCWLCQKAGGNCSWSKNFTPVEGWTAFPTKIRCRESKTGFFDSYDIYECPEFELLKSIESDTDAKLKYFNLMLDNKEIICGKQV